jgi:hypothetical protein
MLNGLMKKILSINHGVLYQIKLNNMSWNYRLGTYIFSYKESFPDNEEFQKMENERLYKMLSVYYEKDGTITGYGEKSDIDGFESVEAVTFTLEKMLEALSKPILDLDNFPKIYVKDDEDLGFDFTCPICQTGWNSEDLNCPNKCK